VICGSTKPRKNPVAVAAAVAAAAAGKSEPTAASDHPFEVKV